MKKSKIIALIVAAVLIVCGICISVFALKKVDFNFKEMSSMKSVSNSYQIDENFSGISVEGAACDVLLAVSKDGDCRVICDESDKVYHKVTVENDTLTIKSKDTRKWYEHIGFFWTEMKVTVYLPQGEFGKLNISTASGDVQVGGDLSFDEITISVASGDIAFSGKVQNELSVKTTSGDVSIKNGSSGSLEAKSSSGDVKVNSFKSAGNFSLKCTSGDVEVVDAECVNLSAKVTSGDVEFSRVVASGHSAVETTSGDIKLSDCDSGSLLLKSGSGDITGTLLSEKIFYADTGSGDIDVPRSSSGGKCEIETGSGDIKFRIK